MRSKTKVFIMGLTPVLESKMPLQVAYGIPINIVKNMSAGWNSMHKSRRSFLINI